MKKSDVSLLAVVCLLAGCGGGGGSGSGSPITVTPAPNPTPSPSPSPSPSPTPTPTPTPTPSTSIYVSPFDLTRGYFFSGLLVEEIVTSAASNGQGIEVISFNRETNIATDTFAFDKSAQSFTVTYQGATSTYGPSDLIGVFPDGHSYAKAGTFSELTANVNARVAVTYVAAGQWRIAGQTSAGRSAGYYRSFVYGEPTRSADAALTGTSFYVTSMLANTINSQVGLGAAFQQGDLTWFRSSGRITGSITLTYPETVKLDVSGDVTNPGSRISLAISEPTGRYSGTMILRFYGPNAVNVGAAVEIMRPDGQIIAGVLVGNTPPS